MSRKDWIHFICTSVIIAGALEIRNYKAMEIPANAIILIFLPTYIYLVIKGIKKQMIKDKVLEDRAEDKN